jgi:hypothetical protein
MRLDALTVAGAAQVVLAQRLDPCFPFNPPARNAMRAPTWQADYKSGGAPGKVMKYMQKTALLLDLA